MNTIRENIVKEKLSFVALLAPLAFSMNAVAWDEEAVCKKVQACITQVMKEEMAGEDIPPNIQQMMQAQIDGMCQSLNRVYSLPGATGQQLDKCEDRILSSSCSELMNDEPIAECEALNDGS
ncbi:MAG: hypothetical protein CMI01_12865 [Oceanospirillaceae bacterium]|nr:hypothetical protein [Oceanospirillaceae bacterium]